MTRTVFRAFALVLALALCAPGAAFSRQTLTTFTESGRPFLQFELYDAGEVYEGRFDPGGAASAWTLGAGHLQALQNASDYWSALWGQATRNSAPVRIIVRTIQGSGLDTAVSTAYSSSADTELWEALAKDRQPEDGIVALVHLDGPGGYLGPMSVLSANGDAPHVASTFAHELGHAMGINNYGTNEAGDYHFDAALSAWDGRLADSFGNAAKPGMLIRQGSAADPDAFVIDDTNYDPYTLNFGGNSYFQGPETMEALGGAGTILPGHTVAGLPANGFEWLLDANGYVVGAFPNLSHIELRHSMMSHQYYRNWGTFMEAELAVLQDIGIPVDRKNFFGSSVYTDNNDMDLTLGFYARNAEGTAYLPGAYNTAPLSVGLHLYGLRNTVRVSGEALSRGYGGVGVRVDGWENSLTINPGTRIHALGEGGAGLILAYGKNHRVTQRGEIVAAGPGGVGARFDFGDNMLGHNNDYRGSYIHSYGRSGPVSHGYLFDELNGPLVTDFDLTGTLAGSAAAIYISDKAHVENINIMNGARLFGDIISHWDPYNPHIQYDGLPQDLTTALNFGLTPDGGGRATATADTAFFLDYRGNITGEKSLNVSLEGGTLAYGGDMDVLSFTAKSGSSLLAVPNAHGVTIAAPDIALESGSAVGLYTGAPSYGAPLAENQTVLRLTGERVNDASTVRPLSEPFMHGFYDYTPLGLDWQGHNLVLRSSRVLSKERAAQSALTAPLAIVAQQPYARLFHDRAETLLARNPQAAPPRNAASPQVTPQENTPDNGPSLWVTPAYGDSRRYGSNSYRVSAPGLALGADRPLGENSFIGMGAYLTRPAYRSDHADIDAESLTGLVYGGARLPLELELDAFAAVGHTRYEQERSVHGEGYATDYSGRHFGAGLSLGRTFGLGGDVTARPFASYEFIRLDVDGYNEGDAGLFGLKVGKSRSDLHRLQAGTSLAYALDKGFVEGRVFYAGLYGDKTPEADLTMTRDPSGYTMRGAGWAQDEHAAGLGINFGLNLWGAARLSGGYSFIGGSNIASHQAELTLSIPF